MIIEGDPGAIFAKVDAIAAATAPIVASFGAVIRFPGTDTFALTLADGGRVMALHEALARSELRFDPSPYPFRPHWSRSAVVNWHWVPRRSYAVRLSVKVVVGGRHWTRTSDLLHVKQVL